MTQLRHYWEDEEYFIKTVRTQHLYGYEYFGNSPRMVVVPQTERCQFHFLEFQEDNIGGSLAGRNGSGKTETIKDLCKTMGRRHIAIDFLGMAQPQQSFITVLRGVAALGAFCCMENVNTLNVQTLAIIAQQLCIIHNAKIELSSLKDVKEVMFEGTTLLVSPGCKFVPTLKGDPDSGYNGQGCSDRSVRALLRPVAFL
ncbi:hypothetical protein IE077_002070, partial [Cardiosporidium cionae]